MDYKDLYEIIEKIIEEKTTFLRHYYGTVVQNIDTEEPTQKGWVKVVIPELGWITPDQGEWVKPRFVNAMLVPKVGDVLDIGFMWGDGSKPVYYGRACELEGQTPVNYNGIPGTHVLWESNNGVAALIYNDLTGILSLKSNLGIFGINTHLHQTGVGPTSPPTPGT